MKVDNTGKLPASYGAQAKPAVRDNKAPASPASSADNVKINPLASQISEVERQVSGNSGFDASKVESIKAAIANGSFTVNPEKIANGLIASTKELLAN